MGSLGFPELLFIFVLALLIFGPRKLPEIGRMVGKGLAEFRKASNDLKRTINAEMIEEELRQSDPRKLLRDTAPADGSQPAQPSAEESSADEPPAERSGAAGTISRGSVDEDGDAADSSSTDPPTAEARAEPLAQ